MQSSQKISRKLGVWVIALVMQVVPAYAQTYLNAAGMETSAEQSDVTEIKPDNKAKVSATLPETGAIFLERSPESVRGSSSNQVVLFSAANVSGKIQVSFLLHGKEFLFVYEAISFNHKQLNSIQLIPDLIEQNRKTDDDDTELTLLYNGLDKEINQLAPLEAGILSSLDLLINMVPKNAPFDKLDLQAVKGLVQPQAFTNVCSQRGKFQTGTFDSFFGTDYSSRRVVGNPGSSCLGRCGTGCTQPLQQKKRQYTSACFVHDLCTIKFGDNPVGDCADEFAAAADGYLNAPNCTYYVVGLWKTQYTWLCKGATYTSKVIHYSNHRFMNSEGYGGVWQVTGNKMVRTYDTGAKYTGTIDSKNLQTKGTMVSSYGVKGCFTENYATTLPRF
ncbi:MAG: hypothetical protein PHR16_13695 [Methylovulum sp.]|nr:hypothetical protein [Methylovulum sp.]